jgi:hypothetical protein
LEKLAAGLVGRQPNDFEDFAFGIPVDGLAASGFDPTNGRSYGLIHEFDRVLTAKAADLDQLVKKPAFALATSTLVTHSHLLDILVFTLLTHFGWWPHPVSSILAQRFLKSLRSFAARVSFILAQFAFRVPAGSFLDRESGGQ